MVNILVVLDTKLSVADFYCKVIPLLREFFTEQLIRLNNRAVIYQCLSKPIPRLVWNAVLGEHLPLSLLGVDISLHCLDYAYTAELLAALEHKKMIEKLGGGKNSLFSAVTPISSTMQPGDATLHGGSKRNSHAQRDAQIAAMVKKLANLGLDGSMEHKLLTFGELLTKMDKRVYVVTVML